MSPDINDHDLLIRIDVKIDTLTGILNRHLHEHFRTRLALYIFLGSFIVGLIAKIVWL